MPKLGMEEIRREQILHAAHKCVAQKSINGTRMKDIAREANISQGIIHYYFETKDNLLHETLAWCLKEYLEGALNRIAKERDPVKRLQALFKYQEQIVTERPDVVEVFYDFWVQGTKQQDIREKMKEQFELYREFIYNLVKEGVDSGVFKQEALEYMPGLVVSLLEGFAIQQIIDPGSFPPSLLREKSLDIILKMITNHREEQALFNSSPDNHL